MNGPGGRARGARPSFIPRRNRQAIHVARIHSPGPGTTPAAGQPLRHARADGAHAPGCLLPFHAPAQRQEKERQALIAKLKKNDRIVNSGGIIGTVDSIKEQDNEVILKGGVHILRSSIVKIVTADEANKEGDK